MTHFAKKKNSVSSICSSVLLAIRCLAGISQYTTQKHRITLRINSGFTQKKFKLIFNKGDNEDANQGWADAMARILGKELPENKVLKNYLSIG